VSQNCHKREEAGIVICLTVGVKVPAVRFERTAFGSGVHLRLNLAFVLITSLHLSVHSSASQCEICDPIVTQLRQSDVIKNTAGSSTVLS
jgi:hypothetical protein